MTAEKPSKDGLEIQRLAIESRKADAEILRASMEAFRDTTGRIAGLLEILKHLSLTQDGREIITNSEIGTVKDKLIGRPLSAHEEDLLNATLINLKTLVGFKP